MSRHNRTGDSTSVNGPELSESGGNSDQPSSRYKSVRRLPAGVVTRQTGIVVLLALLAVLSAAALGPPLPVDAAGGQVGPPADAWTSSPTPTPGPTADGSTVGSDDRTATGEHLSGALAVQEEAVSRDLGRMTLAARLAGAPDDGARARALAGECDGLRERMRSLHARSDRLERAHENGSLTRGEFRAEMTGLEAEARTVADLADECTTRGQRLPDDVVNASTINTTDYSVVGREVDAFSRTELSEHAFDVTVNASTLSVSARDTLTNESLEDASSEQLEAIAEVEAELAFYQGLREDAGAYVNDTAPDDEDAREALKCADDALEAARTDLDRARTAASEGDDRTFEDRMADAREHIATAAECIDRAYEEAGL